MKKITIILVCVLMLGVTGCGKKKEVKLNPDTEISENGKGTDASVENFTFTNVESIYKDGLTTFRCNIINTSKETKNIIITVTMRDEEFGLEKKIIQQLNGLAPSQATQLQTGIVGDYTSYTKIHFAVEEVKVEEVKEAE